MREYVGVGGVRHAIPDWCDPSWFEHRVRVYEEKVLSEIGRVRYIWRELGDVPVDDDGRIEEPFVLRCANGMPRLYDEGTDREDIWHDIEAEYRVSVGRMMEGDE